MRRRGRSVRPILAPSSSAERRCGYNRRAYPGHDPTFREGKTTRALAVSLEHWQSAAFEINRGFLACNSSKPRDCLRLEERGPCSPGSSV
jgi:hypothetical protein